MAAAHTDPPWGLIGYWGTTTTRQPNQPTRFAQQLSQLVSESGQSAQISQWPRKKHGHEHNSNMSHPQSTMCWGIATLAQVTAADKVNFKEHLDHQTGQLTVELSASGLSHSPDIWVRVETDGSLVWERSVFGQVSLYWLQQGSVLWFGTQLRYLLPLLTTRTIEPAGLYGYACFSYVPTPHTPIQGIQSMSAGTQQQHRWHHDGHLITETWQDSHRWQLTSDPLEDEAIAVQQLQTHLQRSIQQQLAAIPSEPVGVFLSGGLDSSVVAALLVQAGVSVRAYSLDFEQPATSELPYARQVAEHLGIPLVSVKAGPKQIRAAIAATAQALDVPFGDSVTVPLYLLNQAAAADTTVVFNGENGDQLFAGWTNKPLLAANLYALTTPGLTESFTQQYLKTFHRLYGYETQAFTSTMQAAIAQLDPGHWVSSSLGNPDEPLLHRLRRASLWLKGAHNIQPRATQLAFAHGLRVRSPFCAPELTRWTFGISQQLYLRGTCEKYILKQAVADWLPDDIVWREKRGMGVPITSWCLNQLHSDLHTWLNPARLKREGLWQPQLLKQLMSGQFGNIRGRRIGEILWLLVMWQQWRQQVLQDSSIGNFPWFWQLFKR